MDRGQFFDRLSMLDEERLKKALWNLYWRGSKDLRRRVEAETDPEGPRPRAAKVEEADPEWTLGEVRSFVELARAGAYLAGDRRVTPRQRTRWRFELRRLVGDVERCLGEGIDEEGFAEGAAAMELLVDLAQEMRGYDYFRSEDPIEAARVVVSDEVALLWSCLLRRQGFGEFARSAAPQLLRWECKFGWTRRGDGRVAEKETSLAAVLVGLLAVPDQWVAFAERYLEALDTAATRSAAIAGRRGHSPERSAERRAGELAEWHLTLLERLSGSDGEGLLDRIASHPALRGPHLAGFGAELARSRGDLDAARRCIVEALQRLPGHEGFLRLAEEVGAPLPARAEEIRRERAR